MKKVLKCPCNGDLRNFHTNLVIMKNDAFLCLKVPLNVQKRRNKFAYELN